MIEFISQKTLSDFLHKKRKTGKTIGFVPTMGALHDGHFSLIEKSKLENDIVVCSIYINDLQFNQQEDFINYPKTLKEDKLGLNKVGCDVLYLPLKEELFPSQHQLNYQIGRLGEVMEGQFRPGHFQGMLAVVERFLTLIKPDKAYFGEKDYQQLALIRWLANEKRLKTTIVGIATKRNAQGLAMSSRNARLNEEEKVLATMIYETLLFCKLNYKQLKPEELITEAKRKLRHAFEVEYISIADEKTLNPIFDWSESDKPRVFIAAYISGVRLIDNLSLID
ncbi:MAG: pantoate--beta-alanine ligase [Bacteroidetes bacterium]|nr:MAG: pantoate--beta-alanine ligase [Bacteroidota bacterium]MBL1143812.1 pantoate--beta-alanine ligase [Bacteroidota bacterium]NOG56613.1 pantoate--beta-alanine ligase [Bacteroidota bacterium]